MSYIGNTPISVAFLTDTFSGTGSATAFTMTVAPANTSSIIVAITGVLQDPSTYSVSGTTLTFSAAPPSGTSNISVRYLGIPASGVTTTAYRTVTNFTATAAQTSFTVPSYTVGYIDVYRNGVRLVSTDFTATTGTTVVLANPCTLSDAVVTESFYVSSVLNAIPATAGAISLTSATYLTGTLPVANGGTGVTTSTGSGANVLGTSPTLTTPTIDSASVPTVSGTAPLYMCRAWVNFNGTGTVAIRASGNVSSITDNGTGDYTVNFTTAMPDANYSVAGAFAETATGGNSVFQTYTPVAGSVRITSRAGSTSGFQDAVVASVSIFR